MDQVKPGSYRLKVTGSVGSNASSSLIVSFDLIDPCLNASITLKSSPFRDAEYTLGEPGLVLSWIDSELYELDVMVDCGDIQVHFFNDRV